MQRRTTDDIPDDPAPATAPKTAILVIRGWSTTLRWPEFWPRPLIRVPGGEIPDALVDVLRDCLPAATIRVPTVKLGTLSTVSPDRLVQGLLEEVDDLFAQTAFERLIIVAFSAGALLARNLYATACGATTVPDGQVDPTAARPWASRVERLVLLGGITRGWTVSSATPAKVRFLAPLILSLLTFWNRWIRRRSPLFITQVKRGSPFVIESRLKLHQVERQCHEQPTGRLPHTVLLLGSKDEYVSPLDALDLGPRDDFSYIEVPESNHIALLHVVTAGNGQLGDRVCRVLQRRCLLRRALLDSPAALREVAMRPDDIDDWLDEMDRPVLPADQALPTAAEPPVDRVVFVIHGIRDDGFWTKRIAREVKALAHRRPAPAAAAPSLMPSGEARTLVISAPSPSYGFFSIWDFINPWGRQDATHWFLEKYAEVKVRWPAAPVSFIGHSNGTFLAANALQDCRMVAFDRIVFAGSVVRSDYPWHAQAGRVTSVLNLVATADWVVAGLPGAFERLGLRWLGVGGAGFAGFRDGGGDHEQPPDGPRVHNCVIRGGHGAGISEPMWDYLAAFIVDGTLPWQHPEAPFPPVSRTRWQQHLGVAAILAPLLIVLLLAGAVALLVTATSGVLLAVLAAGLALLVNNVVRYY